MSQTLRTVFYNKKCGDTPYTKAIIPVEATQLFQDMGFETTPEFKEEDTEEQTEEETEEETEDTDNNGEDEGGSNDSSEKGCGPSTLESELAHLESLKRKRAIMNLVGVEYHMRLSISKMKLEAAKVIRSRHGRH